ncbi:MAG: heme exporter protein CcmD [Pyrinomonadaceae bacterium]
MNWSGFSMGGYAFYVWGSYIFALIAMGAEVIGLSRRKKSLAQQISAGSALRGIQQNETSS